MVYPSGNRDFSTLNYRNPIVGTPLNSSNNTMYNNNNSMLNTPMGRVYTSPPPVPPRPSTSTYNNGYSGYSSPFSSYGSYLPSYGSYGGYGGYGYGGYRPGFNSFGYYGTGPENRFIQLAEASSRPAFQSIQSILHAFSSVTAMFESSFYAIHSSYMSVLGVADNFGKLRNVFGQIFSALALFRSLGWLYRRILYMLGINKDGFTKESVWSEAMSGVHDVGSENNSNKKKAWPTLLFLSIIIGGPYLLFKLMSELYPNPVSVWSPEEKPGSLAVGLYDFHAASDQELSFSAQQKLMIAPKEFQPLNSPGWLLACDENKRTGLVPNNYIGMVMQSEKTGQTFIEHNGQTYQHPNKNINVSANPNENDDKTVQEEDCKPEDNASEI